MKNLYKLNYAEKKARLRNEAMAWQHDFSRHSYSWEEVADKQAYFEREGRKYGLISEFKANGII